MMNGCVYGFRVKEASCVLFSFLFLSILLWAQERPLFLASILSTKLWHFSSEPDLSPQVIPEEVRRSPPDTTGVPTVFQTVPPSTDNVTLLKSNIDNRNVKTHNNQGCNYFKGKWIVDDTRPLYSGSECTRWLSGMWACRPNHRPDFSYEKLRWKPSNCEMDFTASEFLTRMQDKTVAFIGDSLARQQFQSLLCMATQGKDSPDVQDVGREYGLVKARHAKRPDGWAYRFPSTNTTILYYWSASLSCLEPLNPSSKTTDIAMHLDRPPAFLSKFLPKFNVLVLNTGHHWNLDKLKANRWIMYIDGKPNKDPKIATDILAAKNFTIHSIVHWVNSQLPKYQSLKAFYRTISPRHFMNGDWNTGGTCDNTIPTSTGKEVSQDESKDPSPFSAVKGTNVTLLDITSISQVRDDAHISKYSIRPSPGMQDCLHWCLPGVPDTWNELLFAHI